MAGKAVRGILAADSNVTALVSGRIYAVRAPQGATWPFITFQVIDNQPHETDNGSSAMDFVTYQVNCFAETYEGLDDLSGKVRTALDDYAGTINSVDVRQVIFQDENDLFDEDSEKAGRALDFELSIKR